MFSWTVHLEQEQFECNLEEFRNRTYGAVVTVGLKLYSFGSVTRIYWLPGFDEYSDSSDDDTCDEEVLLVHVFNTVSLRWRTLPVATTGGEEAPDVRSGHTAVLVGGVIYVWGGTCGRIKRSDAWKSEVLYAFDVETHRWFQPEVTGTAPVLRHDHSACVSGKIMYIYGGYQLHFASSRYEQEWTNEVHKLDTTTMAWSLINTRGTPPSLLENHSATIIGTKMFVLGGPGKAFTDQQTQSLDLRVFDTETGCWLDAPSAAQLGLNTHRHSAFSYEGELYVLGGLSNDLWKFNSTSCSWKKLETRGNLPRANESLCGLVGTRIFLIGGRVLFLYLRYRKDMDDLSVLDLRPALKTLCKLAVVQCGLEHAELPHDVRWELRAMTIKQKRHPLKLVWKYERQ